MAAKPETDVVVRGKWLLVLGFLVAIWLPLADTWLKLDPAPKVVELRVPEAWPEMSWENLRQLPKQLESYYDDHFGFRNTLIRFNNRLRLVTGSNLHDTPVIVGKEDWVYINAGGGLLDDRRAVRPYTDLELEEYGEKLVQRRDLLAAMGIPYLYVLAPDKHSIYPEYLPERIRRARERDRTDQLMSHLQEQTDLEILDLRGVLLAAKKDQELYPSNGSHWNDYGAYLAYEAIQKRVARWFPAAAPLPLEAFEITQQRRRGDVARMLGLPDLMFSDYWGFELRGPSRSVETKDGVAELAVRLPPHRLPFAHEIDDPDLPRVVMFRDSFTNALLPFLSQHYQRIAYYWTNFIPMVVRHEKPQLVIEERAERQATRLDDSAQ
ncbi:MAG: hypothetical protein AAF560_00995 [Acidobacteriota bacterium]